MGRSTKSGDKPQYRLSVANTMCMDDLLCTRLYILWPYWGKKGEGRKQSGLHPIEKQSVCYAIPINRKAGKEELDSQDSGDSHIGGQWGGVCLCFLTK